VYKRQDLEGQAERGEIKEVKPGYARNYLLPYGFAVLSTDPEGKNAIRQIELQKEQAEKELEELKGKLAEFENLELIFKKKLTAKGGLFSSVKPQDIEKEFSAKTKILEAEAVLPEPIKEAGEQSVEVKLPHGLSLFVAVKVIAEK
jgi:large subunit ribosomal protein L9